MSKIAKRKSVVNLTAVWTAIGFALVLTACTSSVVVPDTPAPAQPNEATEDPVELPAELPTEENWQLKSGQLIIHVGKTGRLARLGHNHLVSSTKMTGRAWIAADASLRAEVRTAVLDLSVDDPELRAAYRALSDVDWAELYKSRPSAKNIVDTRANMLGPRVLDAKNFPDLYVTLNAAGFDRVSGSLDAILTITVRDVRSQVPIELLWTQADADHMEWQTEFRVNHSDLGLKPFSALGGALAVAEELRLEVSGVLERSGTVQLDDTRVEQESDTE